MLRGDISNRQAPILAFNLDNLLFKESKRPSNRFTKFMSKFVPNNDYFSREINKQFIELLSSVWASRPYSIYLISFRPDLEIELNEMLLTMSICYTSLVCIDDIEELTHSCRYHYTYYFDSDDSLLSQVGTSNARNITEIDYILK